MEEIWKDIEGYGGYYKVSNMGRVMSITREVSCKKGTKPVKGRILKPRKNPKGYVLVHLAFGNKKGSKQIHRLVVEQFIGKIPVGYEVNHLNMIRDDNRVSNLEICTPSENVRHSFLNSNRRTCGWGRFGILNPVSRPVLQYDLNGNLINEFAAINEAERRTGIPASGITKCVTLKYKTSGGFMWKYKNNQYEGHRRY